MRLLPLTSCVEEPANEPQAWSCRPNGTTDRTRSRADDDRRCRSRARRGPEARGDDHSRAGDGIGDREVPAWAVALAAGFASPGFDPAAGGGPVARFDSMPAGKRGVTTTGFNFGNQAGELASFAYCGNRARPPRVRSKRVQVAPSRYG